MAPVSRCELRLPNDPRSKVERTPQDSSIKGAKSNTGAPSSDMSAASGSTKSKHSDRSGTTGSRYKEHSDAKIKPSSTGADSKPKTSAPDVKHSSMSERRKSFFTHKTVEPSENIARRDGKSQELSSDMGVDVVDAAGKSNESAPESAHAERTRDSAEVLEDDSEFRVSVTRDSFEADEHAGHGPGSMNACELLEQCKAEVEEAIERGECEQMKCPTMEQIGTPGDICAQFCHDRQDSPKSVAEQDLLSTSSKSKFCAKWSKKGKGRVSCDMRLGPRKGKKEEVVCKGTYKTDEVYVSLWGSSKAMDFRKTLEAQMKKKRKLLEKMHRKETMRRQKMRRRAKEKRRALKQRDPSKISQGDDKLRINKAYDLRVNYYRQLPMMPTTMQQHFDKFKKPPFKGYVTSRKVCSKRIDEFEKLRMPEKTDKVEKIIEKTDKQ